MAKDAPLVDYIATLTTLDETSDWKSVKKSLNCHFFSCPKKRFFRMVLRDTVGRLVRFCAKNTKFHTSNPKKNMQNKKLQERNLFSPKCSSGSVDFWFAKPDELLGREFRFFYPTFLFCISSEIKASLDSFSWELFCSWDHFFWILDSKRISIISHLFRKVQIFQKNQFTSKCTLDRLKRLLK